MAKEGEERAGFWGYPGRCDIPLHTLDLFVEEITQRIKPDFIIFTGDNPPHNPWNDNGDEIYNITTIFVDLLLNKYNYTNPVFPVLGNHEEYTADLYNPFDMKRELGFLKRMGEIFTKWLSPEEFQHFSNYGYYTSKYLETNLRIIALNCFLCDVLNFFLIKDPTDPAKQFEWLESVLRAAERDGEKVFLIGHIPPGDSTYLSECSKRYNALTDRFSHIIRGHFYGHTHYDEFRVINQYFNSTVPAGIIFTAPSLTSYSFQHPSFRIYEMDEESKLLLDFHQYRMNLTEANLNPGRKPEWRISYSAREKFGVSNLNDLVMFGQKVELMLTDSEWMKFINSMFFADGSALTDLYIKDQRFPKFINCRFKIGVFDEYLRCTGFRTCKRIL
jgi:sphingomyelin phosphodiesterase